MLQVVGLAVVVVAVGLAVVLVVMAVVEVEVVEVEVGVGVEIGGSVKEGVRPVGHPDDFVLVHSTEVAVAIVGAVDSDSKQTEDASHFVTTIVYRGNLRHLQQVRAFETLEGCL